MLSERHFQDKLEGKKKVEKYCVKYDHMRIKGLQRSENETANS